MLSCSGCSPGPHPGALRGDSRHTLRPAIALPRFQPLWPRLSPLQPTWLISHSYPLRKVCDGSQMRPRTAACQVTEPAACALILKEWNVRRFRCVPLGLGPQPTTRAQPRPRAAPILGLRLSHLGEHSHFQLLWLPVMDRPADTGNLICLLSDSYPSRARPLQGPLLGHPGRQAPASHSPVAAMDQIRKGEFQFGSWLGTAISR